ncbi:hypothetical protein Tco_0961078 [Tanacetum coccineum]
MALLDHCLNPLFSIKECMSCGALYTADFCCSKGGREDKILVPKPPQNCATCGEPVDGLYCRPCAFMRKCLNEGWYTIHGENKILNTYESSNHNTNVVSTPQEPFIVNQDPGQNSSQSLPQINHNYCYECGDSLDDIFCQRCTCEKIDDEYERDYEIKINQLLQDYNGLDIEMRKKERVLMKEKYLAVSQCIKSICNDEDDSIALKDIIARYSPHVAITSSHFVLPTREPEDTLIIGDEHLDTTPENELDELIKFSVENLVPIPSESEDFSDNESECDVPECDETSPTFTTFSNPLFDSNGDFTPSDDESLSDEVVLMENFKVYSNPLFDDEKIISPKIDPHYFNVESNLIESLLNRDILIDSSPKFHFLLDEFSGELAHINPIPSGIEKADFDLEEEIRLFLSSSPIPVTDSDSLMEEIDLFLASDDLMPPGIENDDYDSEGDIRFLEELLSNNSLPLTENESSNFDLYNVPLSPRPPPEPPDVEICLNFKPDTTMTNDIFELNKYDSFDPGGGEMNMFTNVEGDDSFTFVICIFLPYLTYPEVSPLLSSTKNEDTIFNPGIST